jgi:ribonuclease R
VLVDMSPLAEEAADIHAGDILPAIPLPPEKQRKDGLIRALAVRVPGGRRGRRSLPVYEALVKTEHNIAGSFPQAVLDECAAFPVNFDPGSCRVAVCEEQTGTGCGQSPQTGRRDLRRLDFVTIDDPDARDFDDAVYVERKGPEYILLVAVADVAHYVAAGSALDSEAKARGNSSYFPASVEPMLPEVLSNGLCSLQPGLPRLVLVAQISFDAAGEPQDRHFYPAVIQSKARLTYEEVHAALELKEQSSLSKLSPFLPMLDPASRLAEILFRRRERQGALSFDLPEARVIVDAEGEVRDLLFRKNLSSHKLIEEFMIAANEAVAGYLAALPSGPLFLYRAHPAPEPEKLRVLHRALAAGGLADRAFKSGRSRSSRDGDFLSGLSLDLQAIIGQARGKPEEFAVNRLLLRSMMQARYTPRAEGHFGLASSAYCHFTSPIRRYADLTVHRALRHRLGLQAAREPLPGDRDLAELAESLNNAERNSIEAERDIYKICAALLLERRYKEDPSREYSAVVAGLSSFGLYVELTEMPVEGFVPVEGLSDDLYRLDAEQQLLLGLHTGAIYRLGQALRLVARSADPARREIRFALAQKPVVSRQEKRPKGRGKSGHTYIRIEK